jgi:hypothetical protein
MQKCDLYTRKPDEALRAIWAPGGEPIVMHLSNFRPVKRITDAVETFALVRARMPAKLVLIGDGPDRGAAEYLVRKKKLQKDVLFLGKQDQVYRLLSEADLFLLPSQLESFGLAALEAMACEVPVVASRIGGLPELATRIPIKEFIDHGANTQPSPVIDPVLQRYAELYAKAKHTVAKPGDKIAIAGLDWRIVAAAGEVLKTPLPAVGKPNPYCASFQAQDVPKTEDDQSVVSFITFGKFTR